MTSFDLKTLPIIVITLSVSVLIFYNFCDRSTPPRAYPRDCEDTLSTPLTIYNWMEYFSHLIYLKSKVISNKYLKI